MSCFSEIVLLLKIIEVQKILHGKNNFIDISTKERKQSFIFTLMSLSKLIIQKIQHTHTFIIGKNLRLSTIRT